MKLVHAAEMFDRHVIRFYAAPVGEPDYPWMPLADLLDLCRFPPGARARFEASDLARKANKMRDIPTKGGPLRCVPSWMAREILRRAANAGWIEWSVRDEVKEEATHAMNKAICALPRRDQERYVLEAKRKRRECEEA